MNQSKSPKSSESILFTRKFSWLDHAEKHFKDGAIFSRLENDYIIWNELDEHLMFLDLMAYYGMFD